MQKQERELEEMLKKWEKLLRKKTNLQSVIGEMKSNHIAYELSELVSISSLLGYSLSAVEMSNNNKKSHSIYFDNSKNLQFVINLVFQDNDLQLFIFYFTGHYFYYNKQIRMFLSNNSKKVAIPKKQDSKGINVMIRDLDVVFDLLKLLKEVI